MHKHGPVPAVQPACGLREETFRRIGGRLWGGTSNQKGAIEGVVTAKDTDKPILLASVRLLSTDKLTLTDTSGSFKFKDIEPGTYKLEVKRNGYATYTSGEIKVEAGKTVRHNIALESIQSDLQILDTNGVAISVLNVGHASHGVFVLKNAGQAIVEWEIPKLAVAWISGFSKQSGKLAPGAADTVKMSIDRIKLSEGANEAVMYIGSSVGDKKLLIKAGVERSFCFTDAEGNEISELDLSNVEQYRFNIKNTGNDVLSWTVGEIEVNWLTFVGKADGKLDAGEVEARTLELDRTYLEEGTYETTLVFSTNAGVKSLPIKVKIEMAFQLVNDGDVEISELEFDSETSQRFRIKNAGNGVLNWAVSSAGTDWLTLGDKRRGSLQPGATETIGMTIDRTKLSVGDNRATVTVGTNAGDKQLQVNAHMELSYSLMNAQDEEISVLDLGRTAQGSFKIKNTGSGVLEWAISRIDADWLSLSGETKGTLWPEDAATVELAIEDLSKLSAGMNEAVVYVGSTGGEKQLSVRFVGYTDAVGADYVETAFGMEFQMVAVHGGTFLMGVTEEQQGNDPYNVDRHAKPVHKVMLDGYYIGAFEITQAQWEAVMGPIADEPFNNGNFMMGENYPMYVNWYGAQEFCSKLSEQTGKKYRLPTEAEWEYAARGGQKADGTMYAGSDVINEVAWYSGNVNYGEKVQHPVGQKKPNGLGLYDMSGNVSEWCSDWFGDYGSLLEVNPQGPKSGTNRVSRGEYNTYSWGCRVSCRNYHTPEFFNAETGFRVVCEP